MTDEDIAELAAWCQANAVLAHDMQGTRTGDPIIVRWRKLFEFVNAEVSRRQTVGTWRVAAIDALYEAKPERDREALDIINAESNPRRLSSQMSQIRQLSRDLARRVLLNLESSSPAKSEAGRIASMLMSLLECAPSQVTVDRPLRSGDRVIVNTGASRGRSGTIADDLLNVRDDDGVSWRFSPAMLDLVRCGEHTWQPLSEDTEGPIGPIRYRCAHCALVR